MVKLPPLKDYKADVSRENMCLGRPNELTRGMRICARYLEDIRSKMHVIKCVRNFDLCQEMSLEV